MPRADKDVTVTVDQSRTRHAEQGILHKQLLERVPIGLNHPIDKNSLNIKEVGHVLVGKVDQLFRNML